MTVNTRQSFKLKLCVGIFSVALATFLLVFAVCSYFVHREVRNDLDALAEAKLDYVLRSIDKGLTATEVSAGNLEAVCNSTRMKHDEEYISYMCMRFLNSNPRIQGITIGYEPNVVAGHESGFAPYIMRCDTGFIYHDLEKVKDYRSASWYKETRETGKKNWSKPFIETNGTMITSFNTPLFNEQGKVFAVMTCEINLSILEDSLQSLRPYPNSMLTIIDQDGTFIAHPNAEYVMKESLESVISKTAFAPNTTIVKDIKARRRGNDVYDNGKDVVYVYYAPVEANGWTVTMEVPRKEVTKGYFKMFNTIIVVIIVGLILLIVIALAVINRLTRPLSDFAEAARQISLGDFNIDLPVIKDRNELFDLRAALISMGMSLDKHVSELEKTTAARATIESELNVARKIQMAMVPKVFPPYPERDEFDVYASLTPAKAVGGDLYDFLLDGDDFYFCIGDVSGKGVPASLVMAITQALFRIIAPQAKSPSQIACTINNAIAEKNPENMFVTMFIGRCNLSTGEFSCCNCGHNSPATNGRIIDSESMLVKTTAEPHLMEKIPVNLPIGVVENFDYEQVDMKLSDGVSIFLYTDGVTEAENFDKQLYGEERLLQRLKEVGRKGTAQQLIECVAGDVHHHASGVDQSDDMTMLCVRYKAYKDNPGKKVSLSIHNDVEEMARLEGFMQEACKELGIPADMEFQLNLAMDEAVANSVSYAYATGVKGDITLEAYKEDNCLVFILKDKGVPFDPTSEAKDVDVSLSAEERPVGGLGIFLIKQMMTEVSYVRRGDENILIMKKNL